MAATLNSQPMRYRFVDHVGNVIALGSVEQELLQRLHVSDQMNMLLLEFDTMVMIGIYCTKTGQWDQDKYANVCRELQLDPLRTYVYEDMLHGKYRFYCFH